VRAATGIDDAYFALPVSTFGLRRCFLPLVRTKIAKGALGHDPLSMRRRHIGPQVPRDESAVMTKAETRILQRNPSTLPARRARSGCASRRPVGVQADKPPCGDLLAAVALHARLRPAALAGPPIGAVEMGFAHWFTGSPHFPRRAPLAGSNAYSFHSAFSTRSRASAFSRLACQMAAKCAKA
jgi:hypothetical protein